MPAKEPLVGRYKKLAYRLIGPVLLLVHVADEMPIDDRPTGDISVLQLAVGRQRNRHLVSKKGPAVARGEAADTAAPAGTRNLPFGV